jgi:hypothetical protein
MIRALKQFRTLSNDLCGSALIYGGDDEYVFMISLLLPIKRRQKYFASKS